MKQQLRERWRDSLGHGVEERTEQVSADLPYELQSKMFDQLATVSIAGAGLAVTLIGSLLRNAPPMAWIPVGLFGAAAVFAISANNYLIDGLFKRRATFKQSKLYVAVTTALIGLALGSLSMTIYYHGKHKADQLQPGGDANANSAGSKVEQSRTSYLLNKAAVN